MNNNFNLDELEEFLSDSAEQHRMYPSDKVWRNINKEMHGSKRWPALTFGAILTGAIITAGLILVHPDKNLLTVSLPAGNDKAVTTVSGIATGKKADGPHTRLLPPASQHPESFINPALPGTEPASDNNTGFLINEAGEITTAGTGVRNSETLLSSTAPVDATILQDHTSIDISDKAASGSFAGELVDNAVFNAASRNFETRTSITRPDAGNPDMTDLPGNLSDNKNAQFIPIRPAKAKRLSAFFYVTPSISYRYLGESKNIDLYMQSGPIAPNLTHGVNNFVRQRPIAGIEAGGGLMFQLTPSVRVKTGLQFSVRGYSIDAYASKRQPSMLILDRGLYTDSVVAMSNISNVDGYQSIQITNRYFEISAPVTMDLKIADIKKIQLYVAAGLQPTYQFNKGMYMVSADYKNYIQRPELARHFNLNSSLEAFVTYKVGGLTWQAGPQLRYQLLSGAMKEYPIHEHLFDYGFKIGVVKTLR